jgi:nuclear pore complex protein Nup54
MKQVELGQLFLRVIRHVDALEGRFASAMGYSGGSGGTAVAQIEQRLTSLEAELSTSSARAHSQSITAFCSPGY